MARRFFGLAILACGIVTLVWHASGGPIWIYLVGAAQLLGGIALQFDRLVKYGAVAIGAAYLVLCALSVPGIIAQPKVFWTWGNFFYPFANAIGAVVVLGRVPSRVAAILFGACIASYGIEQYEFLARTASLVPTWIPPGQRFWAIATCIPFGLAAIALFIDRYAVVAARLFSLMMILFGVVVWIPILVADPHTRGNWVEGSETFAIGGAAWVLAGLLKRV